LFFGQEWFSESSRPSVAIPLAEKQRREGGRRSGQTRRKLAFEKTS